MVRIVDNEWQAQATNWDVDVVGPRITFRRDHRDICLRLRTDPPNRVVIESIDMVFAGVRILTSERSGLSIRVGNSRPFRAENAIVEGSDTAVDVRYDSIAIGVGGGSIQLGPSEF